MRDMQFCRVRKQATENDNDIRLATNHSVAVKRGYSGSTDFATKETGNGVDYLTKYLGYSLVEAVKALNADSNFLFHPRKTP